MTSSVTLADVLCGLEPGDRLQYSNSFGQVMVGTVDRVCVDKGLVVVRREEWQRLGFGQECLWAADYQLERVLRSR